jgi:cellulose synthase/poly-beta-1,6-N-acetylglucosamine synthase-like glycosyltransferase
VGEWVSEFLFWGALGIVVYTYLGYGLLLFVVNRLRGGHTGPPPAAAEHELPAVTLLIAAFNEATCILAKLENSLALDYPAEKCALLVVADGSTDATVALVARFAQDHPRVAVIFEPERRGKTAAVNRAMPLVQTPLVVLTDANTTLNPEALRRLVAWFGDPAIGGVSGEKRVLATDQASGAGESIYWRYESFLKRMDAQFHTLVGTAGELFALRTALFTPLPEDTVLDDFVQSLKIVQQGYRFGYEPGAFASEAPSMTTADETKRKIRNAAGGFQGIARLLPLFNPLPNPRATFQFVSHRVLRWWAAPAALVVVLLSNLWLAVTQPGSLYPWLLAGQLLFYGLAVLGWFFAERGIKWRPAFVPFYFTMMNVTALLGLVRWLRGRQTPLWEKIARRPEAPL